MTKRSERGSLSGHRHNETWLREQALAASRGAIVITDPNLPDNPIVYANPAFERTTGYSIEEAVGKNCRFLQGEDRDQPDLEELRATIRDGRECQVVLRNYKKDGTLFWNELSISPVHDEEGNLVNFVGVLDDVTERKRMEEALKWQARQVALRADVAAALSSGDTLSDDLRRCAEAMVRHLNAAFARVWTLNEEEDVLELQASAGMYTHIDGPHSRVPVGELKIGLIAQERLPHVTNTVTSDPRVSDKEWARREGMVAFAGYPLIVEDRLVGVMAMFARQALAEDTIDALESVATAVAQGIERKRAERQLLERTSELQAIFQALPDLFFRVAADGTILNYQARDELYVPPEQFLGKRMQEVLPPAVGQQFDSALTQTLETGTLVAIEYVLPMPQGKQSYEARLIPTVTGEVIIVVRNITERKRAEEAVEQSELLYRTVVEQATENIFLVEVETRRIMESNPAFQEMLGYTEEELRSLTLYDIVAADRESIDMNIRRSVEQRRLFVGERKYRRKDGSLVDVEVSASIILRNGRETLCVVAHDVTERKKNEEMQRFLAEASTTLSSSLDYRTTLARMARLAVPYLADWCVVDILEEDGSVDRLAMTHQDPEKVALAQELEERYPPDPKAQRGVSQVLSTGRPELVPEIPESLVDEAARDAEHREILRGLGLKSYMIVPLVARGRTLGAISLVSAESGRRYGQAELELAEELARRAALAVDNARLYRDRIQVARTLQEGLLPSRLPEVPGVEVGLRYLSAGEVDVGGDFYDLFEASVNGEAHPSEPSPSWGIVIGDVAGKGAEAATMLAFARYTIRAVAMHEARPSAILADLNEAMLHQRRERGDYKFCTVAYVRLETQGDAEHGVRITVSRGGHSPPFVLKADGSIYKIGQPGRALGVFDDANLTEQEANLAPGDALVLYTDGVLEARSPDDLFFGEERLMALLRSSVALDASTIANRIEGAVLNFQGQTPRDDIAVLVLRISN